MLPQNEVIKRKLSRFSSNTTMSFEDFLLSLTVHELGVVRQAVEQASEVPMNMRFGAKMEFARLPNK